MELILDAELKNKIIERSVVTIGNFDGVHNGHAALFKKVLQKSRELDAKSVVITFDPHPLHIIAKNRAPKLITTTPQKIALIEDFGIDFLLLIQFTPEFAELSAENFVKEILCKKLGLQHIIIGHDYAFGKNRRGDYETLKRLGDENGFTVEDILPVGVDGAIFSSSLVRSSVLSGDMKKAAKVLGRYHIVSGKVVHGENRGEKIGFPTANIETENELIPPDGVYAVSVAVDGKRLAGACNIGKNPTFNADNRTIEVFLLDFDGSLYGDEVTIHFVEKLRDEKKFRSIEELVQAIKNDVQRARIILAEKDKDLIHPGFNLMECIW